MPQSNPLPGPWGYNATSAFCDGPWSIIRTPVRISCSRVRPQHQPYPRSASSALLKPTGGRNNSMLKNASRAPCRVASREGLDRRGWAWLALTGGKGWGEVLPSGLDCGVSLTETSGLRDRSRSSSLVAGLRLKYTPGSLSCRLARRSPAPPAGASLGRGSVRCRWGSRRGAGDGVLLPRAEKTAYKNSAIIIMGTRKKTSPSISLSSCQNVACQTTLGWKPRTGISQSANLESWNPRGLLRLRPRSPPACWYRPARCACGSSP